jgi:hypothetical protein
VRPWKEIECGLDIRADGSVLRDLDLNTFDPTCFFEAFLRGRHFQEVTSPCASAGSVRWLTR